MAKGSRHSGGVTFKRILPAILGILFVIAAGLVYWKISDGKASTPVSVSVQTAYQEVNGNVPYFTEDELTTTPFAIYSELDSLGRCGTAYACLGAELMPTEERDDISSVRPTGWNNNWYSFIDQNYLYNRCHLIGYQLTGENANERNLITGTRFLNTEGMLPFENEVAEYIRSTGNHVMYRVYPMFTGDNLLCDGVLMEALSVEDGGKGICFCVYCYNIQPGVIIDYATGENHVDPNSEYAKAG